MPQIDDDALALVPADIQSADEGPGTAGNADGERVPASPARRVRGWARVPAHPQRVCFSCRTRTVIEGLHRQRKDAVKIGCVE